MPHHPHNPKHGESRGRCIRNLVGITPIRFEARNGEGVCEVNGPGKTPVEQRWCDRCKDWKWVDGVVAFFQFDYVGCPDCGSTFPRESRPT